MSQYFLKIAIGNHGNHAPWRKWHVATQAVLRWNGHIYKSSWNYA